jgi:predicted small metal-binding protein
MRAIDCPCGHELEGADDEERFRLAREHVDRDHPELEWIANDAYDVKEAIDA